MPTVWIPSLMRDLTGGVERVTVAGATLHQIVEALEAEFPGVRERLCEEGRLRPNIAAVVDGEVSALGLLEEVGERSEIHFLPAVSGGRMQV